MTSQVDTDAAIKETIAFLRSEMTPEEIQQAEAQMAEARGALGENTQWSPSRNLTPEGIYPHRALETMRFYLGLERYEQVAYKNGRLFACHIEAVALAIVWSQRQHRLAALERRPGPNTVVDRSQK